MHCCYLTQYEAQWSGRSVTSYEAAEPDCDSWHPKAGMGSKLQYQYKQKGGHLSKVEYSATAYFVCWKSSSNCYLSFCHAARFSQQCYSSKKIQADIACMCIPSLGIFQEDAVIRNWLVLSLTYIAFGLLFAKFSYEMWRKQCLPSIDPLYMR